MTKLEETVKFFRSFSSKQHMILLYLVDEFGGIFLHDLAVALEVPSQRVVAMCNSMESAGVIKKHYISRRMGRLVKIKVDPDTLKIISRFLKGIASDKEVLRHKKIYQDLIDGKLTMGDKYDV